VATLQPDTLSRLLKMGGDQRQRSKFVLDAAQGMAVDAVVELVQAAASSSGQGISHSLVRMLSKLAVHADEGAPLSRAAADGALRDSVHKMIANWTLDDPNPDGYRLALQKMSEARPVFQTGDDVYPCEPERLLAMGIEIEMLGDPVWRALTAMAAADDIKPLLGLLDEAPEGWIRETLWRHTATPDTLARQLERESPEMDVVERLVKRMGLAAIPALVDAITVANERTASAIIEMTVALGPDAGPLVATHLEGSRPALQRMLLSILSKIGVAPEGFDIGIYSRSADGSVRREAFRAMIREASTRDEAIASALGDSDERIVRLALGAAMNNCPPKAARTLIARAEDPSLSADLRALGIRAASSYKAPETLAFLLSRTMGKRRFLRKQALAAPTPEMLAALAGLSAHWSGEQAAMDILAAAAKSADKDIRDATARRTGSFSAQ
jgi:hypothetical protein